MIVDMTTDYISVIKQLTIGQAKETFFQEYSYMDVEDEEYINEKDKLDSYCEGVEDVIKIIERNKLRITDC